MFSLSGDTYHCLRDILYLFCVFFFTKFAMIVSFVHVFAHNHVLIKNVLFIYTKNNTSKNKDMEDISARNDFRFMI